VGTYSKGHNTYQTLVEALSGKSWLVTHSPSPGVDDNVLSAMSCASSTGCVAVGSYSNDYTAYQTLTETLVGRSLTTTASPNPNSIRSFLVGVSCTSSTSCVAVGSYYEVSGSQPLVETLNGETWSVTPSPQLPPTNGPPTTAENAANNPSEAQCASSQNRCGDPVDTESGVFSHTFSDFAIPGSGIPLSFSHTYDSFTGSTASTPGPLGYGWTDNYNMSLAVTGVSPNQVATITQENGSQVTFDEPASGTTWTPSAPRIIAMLTQNGDGSWTFTRRGTQIFDFNSSGQLADEKDLNGYSTTLSYTDAQLTTITENAISGSPLRTLTVGWDTSHTHITSVTDTNVTPNRTVTFRYNDGLGNLTDVVDVNGGDTHFTYYPDHLLHVMQSPQCYVTSGCPGVENHYDANTPPRVDWQKDELQRQTSFAYAGDPASASGGTTTITGPVIDTTASPPAHNVSVDNYQYGVRTSQSRGVGNSDQSTTYFRYDPDTLGRTLVEDPNGNTTTTTVNGNGNVTGTLDALGRTTSATYNSLNEPLTKTDGNGVMTTYTYDPLGHGNLQTVSTPLLDSTGTNTLATQTTTYAYGDPNHLGDATSMTDPNGNVTSYGYDAYGDRVETKDPLGNVSGSVYNADGWLQATYTPKAGCTWGALPPTGCNATYRTAYGYTDPITTTTDEFGDVRTITDPLGHVSTYGYDNNRNKTLAKDADGNPTTYTYGRANELTITTRPDLTTLTTSYYGDGTVHTQTDGNGKVTTNTYDHQARLTSVTDPLGHVITYSYDSAGNQVTKQDNGGSCSSTPKVSCTTKTYDADNELASITYSDKKTPNVTSITYDHDGQRTAMTDGTGMSKWTYDSLHRMTSDANGAGATVSYDYLTPTSAYDLKDQVGHITYPNSVGTVSQTWNADGQLASVEDWNTKTTTFAYDADGNLHLESAGSSPSVTDTFGFDPTDEMASVSDGNGSTLFPANYTRDANGQLTSDSSVPSTVGSYRYSALNQLCYGATSNTSACTSPPSGSISYGYDNAGNMISDNGTTQSFNAADQLCWTATTATTTSCTPPPTNATKYTDNTSGDTIGIAPSRGPKTSLGYDQPNHLTTFTHGAVSAKYTYDGTGLRMSKAIKTSTAHFAWDESSSLPLLLQDTTTTKVKKTTTTTTTSYLYGPGELPVEQISGTTSDWLHHDQQGSTRLITDATGASVATFTYDPYGTITHRTGPVTTPLLFSGQYQDSESGMYYLRARYYSPSTAQFVALDPLVATTRNPYGYGSGNPLNISDPSGTDANFCSVLDQWGQTTNAQQHCNPKPSTPASSVSAGTEQCNGSDPSDPSTICYVSDGSNWNEVKSDTGPAVTGLDYNRIQAINRFCSATSIIPIVNEVTGPCALASGAVIATNDLGLAYQGCSNGLLADAVGLAAPAGGKWTGYVIGNVTAWTPNIPGTNECC
jgi:RHS repeat-associated protein